MFGLGFSNDDIHSIFRTLAIILHLGNIEIESNENGHSTLKDNISIKNLCQLLGCSVSSLENALCTTTVTDKSSAGMQRISLSLEQVFL
jgi:myosin protein heavy chain